MRYGSVCAGIEAASVAWHPLGWEPVFFSEIEKFPNSVLAHHYPDVPNFGDLNEYQKWPDADIDVLVGGTPCQSFSVAGLRGGLEDPRGNLALAFCGVVKRYRPTWFVWENVPGVLSSNDGRDFGSLIGAMVELGYGIAYRVLDAQHFGVPQRRRRVFVIGYLGDWRRAVEVLFEPESMQGHSAPGRESGQAAAGTLGGRSQSGGFRTTDLDNSGAFIPQTYPTLDADEAVKWGNNQWIDAGKPVLCPNVANPLTRRMHKGINTTADEGQTPIVEACFDETQVTHKVNRSTCVGDSASLSQGARPPAVAFKASHFTRGKDGVPQAVAPPLSADADKGDQDTIVCHGTQDPDVSAIAHPLGTNQGRENAVAFNLRGREEGNVPEPTDQASVRASSGGSTNTHIADYAVRRLTPTECERLQGFPDGYTNVPGASDTGRYKALGNSMAVPVMHWIGERIDGAKD